MQPEKRIIEQIIIEPINSDNTIAYQSRITNALITIRSTLKNDMIYFTIVVPSELVLYKELKFPFKDAEKIRAVLRYEVEPLLSFPIDDAIMDFIVINTEANSTVTFSTQ